MACSSLLRETLSEGVVAQPFLLIQMYCTCFYIGASITGVGI